MFNYLLYNDKKEHNPLNPVFKVSVPGKWTYDHGKCRPSRTNCK